MSPLAEAIRATAGQKPPPSSSGSGRRRSTCSNCRNEAHNRCPTAITEHGRSGWSSEFDCACYHQDPDMHQELVEADDEEYSAQREGHGYWESGDY